MYLLIIIFIIHVGKLTNSATLLRNVYAIMHLIRKFVLMPEQLLLYSYY